MENDTDHVFVLVQLMRVTANTFRVFLVKTINQNFYITIDKSCLQSVELWSQLVDYNLLMLGSVYLWLFN